MPGTRSGSPQARALGAELRERRELANVSIRGLAQLLDIPKTRLARYESGAAVPKPEDVASYLTALGVTGEEHERIVDLARNTESPNWITSGIPGIQQELATLIEFEKTAVAMTEVAPFLVPGLLQIPEYMHAIMSDMSEKETGPRILMRMERKNLLARPDAPHFDVILGESALYEVLGGPRVMAEQLRHVAKVVDENDRVTVRVIKSGARTLHPAHVGQFILFEFAKATPIVQLEHYSGVAFLKGPRDIAAYQRAVTTLRELAMDPTESLQMITKRAAELEGIDA
ncbi:helix-turn-helix protein [Saccharopolyspora erythraea NRRL 2338]|uniref:Transcriptional regulator, XRE family n=2 Tax=Saccharopolyspora erythraea TaxID=1836 RepID=A4F827_SACEN|nr:helix-turn-helix transcriptional regulator [Saccharopolyspora erythraea]EQD86096.1 XRE family transcriptional regulator [Saccharopolyspora erythraea D]PFG94000.1 helix-turn-helix protein [Saccharopolyspora erythraea NRRL 2338]QRK90807.1 helix-turn-helix domain-containing protein [Saccharopolyspora erythraea]CAM00202.1 transcriptional regulator, XRE family [Saccharopolyspora erythraea NRRL 2338]